MTDAQLQRCRERLERFLIDLLEPVGRSERRHWGAVYVGGLLLDGERKSIQPMAARLPDGNEQAMQQLVGQSPWDWNPVWERLGRRMVAELVAPSARVIDDTGFPKQGAHSVGVERQYSGTLGKTANCQVAHPFVAIAAGRCPFRWQDLVQLTEMITRIGLIAGPHRRTLLMPPIGTPPLAESCLVTAHEAAIALPAITVRTEEK